MPEVKEEWVLKTSQVERKLTASDKKKKKVKQKEEKESGWNHFTF